MPAVKLKVAVLGAGGGIGQPLSFLLKKELPAHSQLALYDVAPFIPGVAVDLSHIPNTVNVSGHTADFLEEALVGSHIVVIPAGVPRKPGMERSQLFDVNAGIIKTLLNGVAKYCPDAFVNVITNPVNSMTPLAGEILKKAGAFNPKKLFGVTTLDIIRAEAFLGTELGIDPQEIKVGVIGGHSGNTIIPLLSKFNLAKDRFDAIFKRVQNAGTEVVEAKAGAGSATLSMACAAVRFCHSQIRALSGECVTEYAFVAGACNEINFDSVDYFARPFLLDQGGIKEFLSLGEMNQDERLALDSMLKNLADEIAQGKQFAG
jgi:malate dehydrogenase